VFISFLLTEEKSFNIVLVYLTSFSNLSTMVTYYIMLQENIIIMGGHGQRDESNFPSNHLGGLKISGENPETGFLEESMHKAEQWSDELLVVCVA